jgi:hypothetical protein
VRPAWVCAASLVVACGSVAAPAPPIGPGARPATSVPFVSPAIPPEGPGVAGTRPLAGDRLEGQSRPSDVTSVHFDVRALPLARFDAPKEHTGFWIRGSAGRYRVFIRGPLFAEIVVRQPDFSSFSVFTGGDFGVGDSPKCGPRLAETSPAYWTGFSAVDWADSGVDVEMGIGTFYARNCAGVPSKTLSARAEEERLVVFLPRGRLVATGGDPASPLASSNTGPFTRLTLRIEPGGASSASVRLSPASIDLWTTLRKTMLPVWSFKEDFVVDHDLLVGVDVVSQGETTLGSVFLSLPQAQSVPTVYGDLISAARKAAS